MCPNCVLSQNALGPGINIAFGVCGVFFILGLIAIWWSFRNGEFEDMEDVKYEMMDDNDNFVLGKSGTKSIK